MPTNQSSDLRKVKTMRYYVVDAFTDQLFSGNPAGVCPLESWLSDDLMQNIARENNLAETAFAVRQGQAYGLRWFTPIMEIALCGHATLATAFVLSKFYDQTAGSFEFRTMSGPLFVEKKGDWFEMNFPARRDEETAVTEIMRRAVGRPIVGARGGYNLTLELEDEKAVREMTPDTSAMREMPEYHGVIVTAAGSDCDFVSRFFAPNMGIDEDPVTGSSHTSLIPFWAARLGKKELTARQLSRRGGSLVCRDGGERVYISGQARLYLVGDLQL